MALPNPTPPRRRNPGQPRRELPVEDLHFQEANLYPSRTGSRLALLYAEKDQAWIRVIDVDAGKTMETVTTSLNWGIRWSESDQAYFYCAYNADDPKTPPKMFRHVIGEPVASDRLVFGLGTPSSKYLAGWSSKTTVGFSVGKKTMTLFFNQMPAASATREVDAGPSPTTILVSQLDAKGIPSTTFRPMRVKGFSFAGACVDGDITNDLPSATLAGLSGNSWPYLQSSGAGTRPDSFGA